MNDTLSQPASDEHLMLAFSQGSPESFTELFRRYKLPIYGFFRRRVTDPAHAEELTQETFLALVRSASRYEPREPRPFASRRHRIRPLGTPRPRQARLDRPRNPDAPRIRATKLRRNR